MQLRHHLQEPVTIKYAATKRFFMLWVKKKHFCACDFDCSGFYRTNYTHSISCYSYARTDDDLLSNMLLIERSHSSGTFRSMTSTQLCMMTSVLALVIFCILHGNYYFQYNNKNNKNRMRRVLQNTYVIFWNYITLARDRSVYNFADLLPSSVNIELSSKNLGE